MSLKPDHALLLVALLLPVFAGAADPYDTESDLRRNHGYLVIDTIIARPVTRWRLTREFTIDRLPLGRQTLLVRLPEGRYQWQELSVPYFDLPHVYDTEDDRRWSFRIERQKINYAGTLIVDELRSKDAVGVRFINRSSEVGALLEENYASLLEQFGLVYSGWYRDDYLRLGQAAVQDATN